MTRLAILGAAGRMGQALIRCAQRFEDTTVVAAIEQPGHVAIGTGAGAADPAIQIQGDWQSAHEADVVIDFTFHTAVTENLEQALANRQAVVLGTTGLSAAERQKVESAAVTIPIVWAPNMSLGVNVLLDLLSRAAATLGEDYDVEIVEMHHRHKQDAPSGTALALAESVNRGLPSNRSLEDRLRHGREGFTGERERGVIGMHALRGGDVVGDHTVMFATDGERIELTHKAASREAFAMGAIKAARWLKSREAGLYSMRHVLGLDPA